MPVSLSNIGILFGLAPKSATYVKPWGLKDGHVQAVYWDISTQKLGDYF